MQLGVTTRLTKYSLWMMKKARAQGQAQDALTEGTWEHLHYRKGEEGPTWHGPARGNRQKAGKRLENHGSLVHITETA